MNSSPESQESQNSAAREVLIVRTFKAPRELVFAAWTEPRHLKKWFAPEGCTVPHCTTDLRPGGMFHFCMRMANGVDGWGRGIYREIVQDEKIVYVDAFSDAEGNFVEPAAYGLEAAWPAETVVEVRFETVSEGTRVTLRNLVSEELAKRTGAYAGWNSMLDRLAVELPNFVGTEAESPNFVAAGTDKEKS